VSSEGDRLQKEAATTHFAVTTILVFGWRNWGKSLRTAVSAT